jgi:anthranilate synthase component 1
MIHPTYSEFKSLAAHGNLIPVYRELDVDLETPVSVYLKLRGKRSQIPRSLRDESFLLESVEGGEQLARYSYIAANPARVLTLRGNQVTLRHHACAETLSLDGRDPLDALRDFVQPYHAVPIAGLPRFFGGAVGYLSYDVVRHIERLPNTARDELDLPDAIFLLTDTLIAFDHVKHRALIIANAHVDGNPRLAHDDAMDRIERIAARLSEPMPTPAPALARNGHTLESNVAPEQFAERVRRAQEHIAAGDIFQVVLSQRFSRETDEIGRAHV